MDLSKYDSVLCYDEHGRVDFRPDIAKWCEDSGVAYVFATPSFFVRHAYFSEADLLLFKMRWGGD